MKIVSERKRHDETIHLLTFTIGRTGCGYSFNCDKDGQVDVEALNPDAKTNYDYCEAGQNERGEKIIPKGVRDSQHSWIEEAIGQCGCGEEVELNGFTNTCEKCGTDYNQSGQRLAPREQWGEETGEHPADISRIP